LRILGPNLSRGLAAETQNTSRKRANEISDITTARIDHKRMTRWQYIPAGRFVRKKNIPVYSADSKQRQDDNPKLLRMHSDLTLGATNEMTTPQRIDPIKLAR
jgi:hypothetical protein